MSAPEVGLRRSENINCSFLAIRASNALKSAIEGRPLPDEQKAVLARAASFLGEVSSGAEFIAHGNFAADFRPSSVSSLHQVMEPIKRLQVWKQDEDLAKFFQELAVAVRHASTGAAVNGEKDRLSEAIEFFDAFYESLEADQNSRHPPLGSPSLVR